MMTQKPVRRGRFLSPPSLVGLAAGLVPIGLSVTPSLLPRPFVMQGVITGICVALGYAIGVFVAWAVRRLTKWEPAPRTRRIGWIVVLAAALVVILAAVFAGTSWQNEVRRLVDEAPITWTFLVKAIPVAALVAALLVIVARALRAAARGLASLLERRRAVVGRAGDRRPHRRARRGRPVRRRVQGLREDQQRHLRQQERHDGRGHHAAVERDALGQQRLARVVGVSGPRGPQLRGSRRDRGAASGLQRAAAQGADQGVRRAGQRADGRGARRSGGATSWSAPARSRASSSS